MTTSAEVPYLIVGLLLSCLPLFSGCRVQPVNEPVPVVVPEHWDQAAENEISWPAPDWWRKFGSPELDRLQDEARNNNTDLAAAAARILQAEAQAKLAGAVLLPALDLEAGAARHGGFGGRNHVNPANNFTLAAGATYEIDFWGKNRARLTSAQESLQASRFERETVALTLTSSVAITYFQILSLRERITLARLNLENAEDVLRLVEARVKYGAVSPLDQAQQRSVVARQRAAIPPLVQQERDARAALALLLGKPPQSFDLAAVSQDQIILPEVVAGLPSALLARRPDIQSAEANLRAANADIAAARAAYFPSIELTGSAGLASTVLSGLLDGGLLYDLAVSVTQPIFDAGRREAQEELAVARRTELVQSYRASVINAFADVDIALGTIRSTAEQQTQQAEQLQQAELAMSLAEQRYREGAEDLLTVLDSQRTLFDTQDLVQQSRFRHLQSLVSLYRALGGGWEKQ